MGGDGRESEGAWMGGGDGRGTLYFTVHARFLPQTCFFLEGASKIDTCK